MPRAWRVLESRISFEDPYIRLRTDRCQTEAGNILEAYHVVEYPDWLNTVALTSGFELILVEEYRHGAGSVITGIPSGTIDPGEEPIAAATRELREETGYTAGQIVNLGWAYANPATQNNRTWSFLALDAELTSERQLDQTEDIDVKLGRFAEYLAGPGPEEPHALHLATLHAAVTYIMASNEPRLADLRALIGEALITTPPR